MKGFLKVLGLLTAVGALIAAAKILIDLFYNKCDTVYFSTEDME